MDRKENYFTISQLSAMLDLSGPTLRFWEKELEGILLPLRTSGGQRRYTPEHVSIIEEIKLLKKAGLSLADIKRKLENRYHRKNLRIDGIDILVNRLAEVVKIEIHRFFQAEMNSDQR